MVDRVELKIEGMYQAQDNLHNWKYILYLHGKYIKRESGCQSDDIFVPFDTAECCSVSEISTFTLHL